MLPVFLRLKLRLLVNSFRRSPWQAIGLAVGVLYGLGVAILGAVGLSLLRLADAESARAVTVIAGSVVTLGFLLVPLAFGVDDTLDPRRFSLFGLPNTRLATWLAIAALISVPSVAVTIVALASIITWARDPGPFLLAVISALVIVATCVLGARVTTSVAAFLLASRRSREFTAIVGILVLVLVSPAVVVLANADWTASGGAAAQTLADILAWTPLGAAWGFPGDAATGNWNTALLHLMIAAAFLGLLWLAWRALVAWMLVTPEREVRAKAYGGLGWFDRLPATPGGAVAARSVTYWIRDPRYRMSLIGILIPPFVMLVPLLFVGVPVEILALIPVPVICLLLGWSLHNDVAYDNTAVWLHVASATSGRADRWGRLFPALALGIPLLIVGSVASAAVHGDWSVLGGLLGVGGSLLFGGLGFGSIMSARFPYPVVRPGDSPFSQPQSTGGTSAFVQSVAFLVSLVLALPAMVLAGMGLLGSEWWFWASLSAGLTVGLISLWGGVRLGARIFDRRGPEILSAALLN